MTENFDVIVIGMGPGGEVAASQLLERGKRVAATARRSPSWSGPAGCCRGRTTGRVS